MAEVMGTRISTLVEGAGNVEMTNECEARPGVIAKNSRGGATAEEYRITVWPIRVHGGQVPSRVAGKREWSV